MSSPSVKPSSLAKTVITSLAPSPRLLLKLLSSPVTWIRPASMISALRSSDSRAMTLMVSAVPDSRRVSTGKMKKRSPRLMCENAGAAASIPLSTAWFLMLDSSIAFPPYRLVGTDAPRPAGVIPYSAASLYIPAGYSIIRPTFK